MGRDDAKQRSPDRRGGTGAGCTSGTVRVSALLPRARFVGCDDIVVRGLCDDAEACRPGDVFVARGVGDADGHDLVGRAILRGAAAIVADRMVPTFGTPLCLVADTCWAHARLAQALAGDPSASLRVTAVTGTSGKTTTAWLAAAVLSEGEARVGVLSDLGCLDGAADSPRRQAWTSPAALGGWFARLADSGCSHAVVEASSEMLARWALAGVECGTVVVTNLGRAHLDRHGTVAAYHRIKTRILDTLSPSGTLVVNVDDARVARLAERHERQATSGGSRGRSVRIGLGTGADVTATALERGLGGQTFLLRHAGDSAVVTVATPVVSFVRDSLCAAAVGLAEGMTLGLVARGLEAAGNVPGRLDRLRRGQDVHLFVDQPTSIHALASTLSSLRRLTPGRLVILAEEPAVARLGGVRGFGSRVGRWCDESMIVPATLLDPEAGRREVAAYARLDRLLVGLSRSDCVLVVGAGLHPGDDPGDPGEPAVPLAVVVDTWMELAHPPETMPTTRRAA